MPQERLLGYLKNIGNEIKPNEIPGMDCSLVKTKIPDYYLISTTDFFFPLVDDPYLQGRIACCNVLSDLYAMGVYDIDTMLMVLSVSTNMSPIEQDVVSKELIQGFNDTAKDAGTNVTGGQTIMNKWCIIGGVGTALGKEGVDFIRPIYSIPGDVIVLTKPLGTQIAVNIFEWMNKGIFDDKSKNIITREQGIYAYNVACESMSRLNKNGAKLLHKYHAHACTDVTGFGIQGHANNLAEAQLEKVDVIIHTLPVIKYTKEVNSIINFRLLIGRSAETSGGLLVVLPPESAQAFINEIQELDGQPAWIVGKVIEGSGKAVLSDNLNIIEV